VAKSDVLRVWDVRDAYRVIGECRDLGSDPSWWQPHMFAGLSRLFGEAMATDSEGRLTGPDRGVLPLTFFHHGFDAADRRTYMTYIRAGGTAVDPFVSGLLQTPGTIVTRRRPQGVEDSAYHRSPLFDRYLEPGNVHHRLASTCSAPNGHVTLLHLHRRHGTRDFTSRQQVLLEFFHGELRPLIGRALVSAADAEPASLPRRLRQVLACLVEGDSEKQAAARLGVSPATAHQYVTAHYRRFGVSSRGQLLAHVVKRMARPGWRSLLDSAPDD
jgi:DNA-binding CsgD family transcriptional regulator